MNQERAEKPLVLRCCGVSGAKDCSGGRLIRIAPAHCALREGRALVDGRSLSWRRDLGGREREWRDFSREESLDNRGEMIYPFYWCI